MPSKKTLQEDTAPPPWNIKDITSSSAFLTDETAKIITELKKSNNETQISFLTDTRHTHKRLFKKFTPSRFETYAGTYRGTPRSVLEDRKSAVFYKNMPGLKDKNPTSPPHIVLEQMRMLAGYIEKTCIDNYDINTYFMRCTRIFGDFNIIHPYLDGNGHMARLILLLMAYRKNIEVCPTWTAHPRPYNNAMGICLQNYQHYPDLLEQFLKKWFFVK